MKMVYPSDNQLLNKLILNNMKNKEKVKVLIAALKVLKEDAKLALNGDWDKNDDGFRAQVEYINVTLALVKQ